MSQTASKREQAIRSLILVGVLVLGLAGAAPSSLAKQAKSLDGPVLGAIPAHPVQSHLSRRGRHGHRPRARRALDTSRNMSNPTPGSPPGTLPGPVMNSNTVYAIFWNPTNCGASPCGFTW